MKKLILASQSPRRQELLRQITDKFTVCPADADETLPEGMEIAQQIETLALRKAEAVLKDNNDSVVLGSDTMVIIDGKTPLGKPCDEKEAENMLKMLSGKVHEVITAVALVSKDKKIVRHRVTKVKFRTLSEKEITKYIKTGEPMDKAGAYGIQGYGAVLVDSIDGDYFSVVGLPLSLVYTMLCEFGIIE